MRIHTSATRADLDAAARAAGVALAGLTEHGSRTHARAFEVRLSGSGNYGGQYGTLDHKNATWDEWGIFLAAVYEADADARCGGSAARPIYANADDYHWQTGERFLTLTPGEQHKRHRWEYVGQLATGAWLHRCKGDACGATMRRAA